MKTIPIELRDHYAGDATTTCFLLRMACKDGTVLGFASLDADLDYDDGDGLVTYRADNGFRPDRMQATADLAVDNTDLHGWVSDVGVTEAQIRSGLFDYAKVRIYRVNYLDLAAGHEIIATGTAGETAFSAHGWRTEFRSLTQQLKQPISQLYSRTCRARYGSQYPGTNIGQPEERKPCGAIWVWTEATITAVDPIEPDRIFSVTGLGSVIVPSVIRMTSGDNAGKESEIDAYTSGEVTLTFPLPYVPQVGDTLEYRDDCSKIWDDAEAGCLYHWGAERPLHFRGEHLIPSDGQSMVPGADIERA